MAPRSIWPTCSPSHSSSPTRRPDRGPRPELARYDRIAAERTVQPAGSDAETYIRETATYGVDVKKRDFAFDVASVLRWRKLADRPEGWVVRVASNLAIDRYRRRH